MWFLRPFGHDKPHNKIDQKAAAWRKECDKNEQDPEKNRILIEIFSQSATNTANFFIIGRSIKSFHASIIHKTTPKSMHMFDHGGQELLRLSLQIALALCDRKSFDCIPQHRARHPFIMLCKKSLLADLITLANLAQHPSYGFVDKVFFIA